MSDRQQRYYRLAEANAQLAELNQLFPRVIQLRGQLKTIYRRLENAGFAPPNEEMDQSGDLPAAIVRDRATFYGLAETLKEQVENIVACGCVIKDIECCLVDWPSIYGGREICLCWKYGEGEVCYWHELDDGFAARRPVSELLASV